MPGSIVIEPWVLTVVGLIGGAFLGAITRAFFAGRHVVTVADLNRVRDELRTDIAGERRDVGEGLKAIRQKVADLELELAKDYVRKDSWQSSMDQIRDNLGKSDAADQQWRLRIEDKIDQLGERIAGHQSRGRA